MNNYFANYQNWNDRKQRVAVFGRETETGKLELFELCCSKLDLLKKQIAKELYNAWKNGDYRIAGNNSIISIKSEKVIYHPKIHTIDIKQGDSAKFTFNEYCKKNFYHQYEGVAIYEEKYLYKKGQPKIVLKSKRLNKMDATY